MKHLKPIAVIGLLAALQGAGAAYCAPGPLEPCTLARSVLKQQGLLDPRMAMLPSAESFAAANGDLKLVLACGLSSDETYTFSRLLARVGVGLLEARRIGGLTRACSGDPEPTNLNPTP